MDGIQCIQVLAMFLNEAGLSSSYISRLKGYDCLDAAACDYAQRTKLFRGEETLTTVADQAAYDLSPAWIEPLMRKPSSRRFFGKYTDGDGNVSWPVLTDFEKVRLANLTDSVAVPEAFCIRTKLTQSDALTGAATSDGAASGGKSTLTDSGAAFTATVKPRDYVHNITTGTRGRVIRAASATALEAALFDPDTGDAAGWTAGDAYRVQPAARFELVFRAPPENAGDTLLLDFVSLPSPMMTDYDLWLLPEPHARVICREAASLFAANLNEPKKARDLHAEYENLVRRQRVREGRLRLAQSDHRYRV